MTRQKASPTACAARIGRKSYGSQSRRLQYDPKSGSPAVVWKYLRHRSDVIPSSDVIAVARDEQPATEARRGGGQVGRAHLDPPGRVRPAHLGRGLLLGQGSRCASRPRVPRSFRSPSFRPIRVDSAPRAVGFAATRAPTDRFLRPSPQAPPRTRSSTTSTTPWWWAPAALACAPRSDSPSTA